MPLTRQQFFTHRKPAVPVRQKLMSMAHAVAWIFEVLLRLVLPPSGRHRAADGHGAAMVRPNVVAHEQQRLLERAERRLRRQRRRALWLAMHGVDVGPRLIHGVKVAA